MTVVVLASIIGSIIGLAAAALSTYRSAAQPTGAKGVEERQLIGAVLNNPALYRYATIVTPDDFSWEPHQQLWAALSDTAVDDDEPAHVAEAAQHGVPSKTITLSATELQAVVADRVEDDLDDVVAVGANTSRDELLKIGGEVMSASAGRGITGWDVPEPGTRFDAALVRERKPVSVTRLVMSALFAAASLGLVAAAGTSGVALAAAGVLLAGSVLAALVDLDTLYVDTWSLIVLAAAIVVGLVAAYDSGDLTERLLFTALVLVVVIGSFELVAWIWSKVRGQMGLGGGDSIVLVPTLSVPILATGQVEAALWGLVAGLFISIVAQMALIISGRAKRDTPFALVPYLLAGWPLGWALAVSATVS